MFKIDKSYRDRKEINGCLERVCLYVNEAVLKGVGRDGLAVKSPYRSHRGLGSS